MPDHPLPKTGSTASPVDPSLAMEVRKLTVTAGSRTILRDVFLQVPDRGVLGIIGPSGAGKSTLLKCLNRLIELTPQLRVNGGVSFRGRPIQSLDPDQLRVKIATIFQQPVVFPASIRQNVLFGVRHLGRVARRDFPMVAERALREAALWQEVCDRLDEPALRLSIGQQQRLCLARALALDPEVLLMDEPTSALDPRSTDAIESLILRLADERAIVLVTHNVGQARRVTGQLACVCVRQGAGEIVETACCDAMLGNPQCQEVIDYLARAES